MADANDWHRPETTLLDGGLASLARMTFPRLPRRSRPDIRHQPRVRAASRWEIRDDEKS